MYIDTNTAKPVKIQPVYKPVYNLITCLYCLKRGTGVENTIQLHMLKWKPA